ncbi:MAG: hypothetical protein KBG62_00395 [Propionivibrio sp.]|jgi:hypothetical protein|nr:hypothetical protein [Propionivibrio sp.]
MKFLPGDLKKLQISLLVCLLMIVMGAAVVFFANGATRSAQHERVTAQAQRNDYVGKLQRVSSEESEIKEKSALFQRLQKRGIIGEEQRLEWVELLKDIRDKRRLIDLVYEIEPQRPLDVAPGAGFTFNVSPMKVQLKLLHEEDLTRFLGDLNEQARALIQVRYCKVTRQPQGQAGTSGQANLLAECRIDWVTLREVAGK